MIVNDIPSLIDTGADQTVIPSELIERLALPQSNQQIVQGFDGGIVVLPTVFLNLQVRNLTSIELEVIASDNLNHVILGRDVLNRYFITLDGVNGRIDISE